jgi:ribosomal subunit interface protein
MQIEVKGRNTPVNDELREYVEKRFRKVANQVSELARLEIELKEEKNPAIADNMIAEATLTLKGVTLRARDNARDLRHAISDQPLRGGAQPPGQAPPREAPRAAQGRDRGQHPHGRRSRGRGRDAGRFLRGRK